jgi:hypothetical protein
MLTGKGLLFTGVSGIPGFPKLQKEIQAVPVKIANR